MRITALTLLLAILPCLIYSLALTSNQSNVCAFNTLGLVPGQKNYTFSVIKKHLTPAYNKSDFNVTWKKQIYPSHPFFNWIGLNNFRNEFQAMGCQIVPPTTFGAVCGYSANQTKSYYDTSFGPDIAFQCTVPKNNFLMSVRFVPKINGWNTSAYGRWSVFSGLYKYTSVSEANTIIKTEGTKIFKKINATKLNAYDISTNLNILPEYTQSTLSYEFNKNIHTPYAANIKTNTSSVIVEEGYLKILPPGSRFIAGAIYNGTSMVKQICDNVPIAPKDNCNITL